MNIYKNSLTVILIVRLGVVERARRLRLLLNKNNLFLNKINKSCKAVLIIRLFKQIDFCEILKLKILKKFSY